MTQEQSPSATPPSAEGVITKSSPFSVEETLQRFQEAMHSKGMTVFARIDHSDEAEKVGLKMQEAHVLIFGNPKGGTPLMVASPLLALDLPLKILVWQSSDGRVWVSYTDASYIATRYAIPQELVGNLAGINGLVESVLHSK